MLGYCSHHGTAEPALNNGDWKHRPEYMPSNKSTMFLHQGISSNSTLLDRVVSSLCDMSTATPACYFPMPPCVYGDTLRSVHIQRETERARAKGFAQMNLSVS